MSLQDEQRFIDRIWKRIYRDESWCNCNDCRRIVNEWLVIFDLNHAKYIYTVQIDYRAEWKALNYRDKK